MLIAIFLLTININVFGGVNPSREEIELMIEEVAIKRGIPAILLKGIARVESVYKHFNNDGSPKVSGTSIGLMQINNIHGGYEDYKLKYNIRYNIEAGADVLLNKWSMSSYQNISSVGNMDPNILENWYFALWAYNGWAQSNNPLSPYAKKYTYQQLVYDVIEKEYGSKINNIDFSYLPANTTPSRSLVVPTPNNSSSGNIIFYEKGDYVRTDGIRTNFHLRDVPAGRYIHQLNVNQLGTIKEGPVLEKGHYWYKVYIDGNREGWIERNWLLRTGDIEHGRYIFDDISFHWARKTIMNLYGKGIISQASLYNPNRDVTIEEFCAFLSKTLDFIESSNGQRKLYLEKNLPFKDVSNISSWALKYVKNLYYRGLLEKKEILNPLKKITRKETTLLIQDLLVSSDKYSPLNIKSIFSDLNQLDEEEILAIKTAYLNGIVAGKQLNSFCPNEYLTRAEAAVIMANLVNKYVR